MKALRQSAGWRLKPVFRWSTACLPATTTSRPRFGRPTRAAISRRRRLKWPTWSRRSSPRPKTRTTTSTTKTKTTWKSPTRMRNLTVNKPSHAGGAHRANTRSARRRAREFALQGIYSWLLRGDGGTQDAGEIDAHIRDADAFSEADAEWFKTLLQGV